MPGTGSIEIARNTTLADLDDDDDNDDDDDDDDDDAFDCPPPPPPPCRLSRWGCVYRCGCVVVDVGGAARVEQWARVSDISLDVVARSSSDLNFQTRYEVAFKWS